MNHFESVLPIDHLFDFLNKPRDISSEEFSAICAHFKINYLGFTKRIIDIDSYENGLEVSYPSIFDLLVNIELFDSKREMRESIKAGSLFINNIQIKNEKFDLKTINFYKTDITSQWGDLKFGVVRFSKKKHEIIFTYQ